MSTYSVFRTDIDSRPLVGIGFTSREQAEKCAEDWRAHWASHGHDMELEVVEVSRQQSEDAIRAIRALYGKVRGL